MELIDGIKISNNKIAEIKKRIDEIKNSRGIVPSLMTILVGNNPASQIYIKLKMQACKRVGIKSFHINLDKNSSQKNIIALIKNLNNDSNIDGILLQLPLPKSNYTQKCINAICPSKDVDGLHPTNAGLLNLSKNWDEIIKKNILISCTPLGVIYLLKHSNIEIDGKIVVIIGRSNLVGKPLSMLLLANNATVIICHSKTKNLKEICKSAEILIVAIGKPKFINGDFIKDGATVIDVGINRVVSKLCGDVDFDAVKNMNIKITHVPGGVGPMTIAMLLENTLKAFNNRNM
ncbi:MAG: bifunctional 5,10-methylenetetrahydrofolate dehydrogenase/5,10-methenyltetrahydrofolate cyclohydrolase [Endomicrobium sp.]|nr:bifunctional 5,10-methylenetetrahydrofolate dehydrogenase/5,10-methenyltetrahydrofolate cyclohydrolase [Endomicrobium sp.]